MIAKKNWSDKLTRNLHLANATRLLNRALSKGRDEDRATALCGLGYTHFLSDDRQAAKTFTAEVMRQGTDKLANEFLSVVRQYPVEPMDTEFLNMLLEVRKLER